MVVVARSASDEATFRINVFCSDMVPGNRLAACAVTRKRKPGHREASPDGVTISPGFVPSLAVAELVAADDQNPQGDDRFLGFLTSEPDTISPSRWPDPHREPDGGFFRPWNIT
jgi:hypothetical protein